MSPTEVREITTSELNVVREEPDIIIVDVRSVDAYNGWREAGEPRGGHIRGARSLPAKWTDYVDWIDIVRHKGFTHDREYIIYGYERETVEMVARLFIRTGHPRVRMYLRFLSEWSPSHTLPMDRLPRYRHLVSARWVKELISRGSAPEFDGSRYVICHAHYRNRSAYERGHIPGAIDLDTNTLESSDTWNRRSPAELREALGSKGITSATTVVLYGTFLGPRNDDPFPGSSAGHLGAMRCAFILLYAGVRDVRVLNGGMQSWLDAGFEVSTEDAHALPAPDFGSVIPGSPELAVDLAEAVDIIGAKDKNLVSVRSWREYIGQVSGYNYIERKGRIRGSVFASCGSDAYHMENYRNLDHTTREYHEIEREWRKAGITPDKHNAFYCGTGWRGSEAFLNAWLMGWPRVSVYDGGWFEWSNNEYPSETGIPDEQGSSD
jgi:thiosulfate/3-mercaptopyruvate sulfurtransferase